MNAPREWPVTVRTVNEGVDLRVRPGLHGFAVLEVVVDGSVRSLAVLDRQTLQELGNELVDAVGGLPRPSIPF